MFWYCRTHHRNDTRLVEYSWRLQASSLQRILFVCRKLYKWHNCICDTQVCRDGIIAGTIEQPAVAADNFTSLFRVSSNYEVFLCLATIAAIHTECVYLYSHPYWFMCDLSRVPSLAWVLGPNRGLYPLVFSSSKWPSAQRAANPEKTNPCANCNKPQKVHYLTSLFAKPRSILKVFPSSTCQKFD